MTMLELLKCLQIVFVSGIALSGAVLIYNAVILFCIRHYLNSVARDPKTGIRKGAETFFLKNGGNTACLLIHGFIGSPTDFGNLPRLLHEQGHTVLAPLLPGHGTDPRDFSKVSPEILTRFVADHYLQLKKDYAKVTLIGFSMGGTLSALTAAEQPVDSLILLAPCFGVKYEWFHLLPASAWNAFAKPFIPFVYRPSAFKQVFNKEAIPFIIDYPVVSTRGADTLMKLTLKVPGTLNMEKIRCPVRILHSRRDRAAEFKASLKWFESLKAKGVDAEMRVLENSNHLVLWDFEAREAEAQILSWIASF